MTAATHAAPALPQTKHDRIVHLLDHWDEIFDPNVTSPRGTTTTTAGVHLMPLMSRHPSVTELARCLTQLATEAPTQYAHLAAYHTAEWRIATDHVRVKRAGNKTELVEHRYRARITPRWIRLDKIRHAHDRLTTTFRGEVYIPTELWDALTKPIAA